MCTKVSNYSKTILLMDPKKLEKQIRKPLHKSYASLETETGAGVLEVIENKKIITDTKPVHVGIAILQHSKLLLLRYVDFLRTYLKQGSYVLVYGGKFSKHNWNYLK